MTPYDFHEMPADQQTAAAMFFAELLTGRLRELLERHALHGDEGLMSEIERHLGLVEGADLSVFSDEQRRVFADAEAAIKHLRSME